MPDIYCTVQEPVMGRLLLDKDKVKVKVAQSCPTLCHLKDYTVQGIL